MRSALAPPLPPGGIDSSLRGGTQPFLPRPCVAPLPHRARPAHARGAPAPTAGRFFRNRGGPIVADGIVAAFRHVWPESWGPRLDYILTNAVRALIDVPGATLLMLPRLLIDEPFRMQQVMHHVGDPVVRAFWLNEFAGYNDHARKRVLAPGPAVRGAAFCPMSAYEHDPRAESL